MGRKTIDLIDRRHMMGILLFLLDNGSSLKTEIYNDVSRNSNMSVRIDDLEDIGLVSHVVTFRGFIYALTPKGRRVAELLRSVEKVLEREARCHLNRGQEKWSRVNRGQTSSLLFGILWIYPELLGIYMCHIQR